MHSIINHLQSTKLNDLSKLDDRANKVQLGKVGTQACFTRLSKAADDIKKDKDARLKKLRSDPNVTPCYQCKQKAKFSAECGCRLHSGHFSN